MGAIHSRFLQATVNLINCSLLLNLMGSDGMPVAGLTTGRPVDTPEAYDHEFALTLSTLLNCDVPLATPCEGNDDGLTVSQWTAWRVSHRFF